jgi:hypothetical protein
MTNEFRNGMAFSIAITVFAFVVIAMVVGSNSESINDASFEVVDKYKECDVVRYAPYQVAEYKYFLYCEKNK